MGGEKRLRDPDSADGRPEITHSLCGQAGDAESQSLTAPMQGGEEPTQRQQAHPDQVPSEPQTVISRPSQIGPYRVIDEIGSGGMGAVYRAEQEHPIRRRVAVKLIKLGMDTAEVIARFETERQALAMMNHPNIAQVFDAGSTEQGRPFFVMEQVDGEALTEYCDRRRLGIDQRLELFIQVCEGVHHAHQKGIIHRDLKPSNILVTTVDERPVPKIIDFGIAKAMGRKLGDSTLTELGDTVGTPEYMSPEQMGATYPDIDIRSDVYSLGVVLYLLLVGKHPFETAWAGSFGINELSRRVCFEDPALPSRTLDRLGFDAGVVAELRRTDARSLAHALRGDLDWVVVKSLEKDRARRYGTALELAADLRRHIDDLPVVAGPPHASYRLKKFIRRHTMGVIAGTTVLAALLLGITGTSLALLRALRAEQRVQAEATTARLALAETQEVSRFLVDLFEVSDPSQARGETITARELLDRGADRVRSGFSEQPLARARFMQTIAQTYANLGLYPPAEALVLEALEIREEALPPDHPDVAASLDILGSLATKQGRFGEAEPLFLRALEIREKALGLDHLDVETTLSNLGSLYVWQGRNQEAEQRLLRALQIKEKALGSDHHDIASNLNNLGDHYRHQGRYAEAEPLLRRALAIKERDLGGDHPSVATGLNNLGSLCREQGRLEEAEQLLRRALAINEKVLGGNHPSVARALYGLAIVLGERGAFPEAEVSQRRALRIWEETLGPEHPNVALALLALGGLCAEQGRVEEAEALLQRALSILEDALGPDHPNVAFALQALADNYQDQGRDDQAVALYHRALTILDQALPPDHPGLLNVVENFTALLRATGRTAEAAELEARIPQPRQQAEGP